MNKSYTVAIRTLGKAGGKYQQELDSLMNQTIKPAEIIVYLAEGYPIPKETCGQERYVYVKKGMVAQRALPYNEVATEWILFLDDDVYLPADGVERMFKAIHEHNADVIAPNTFENHKLSGLVKFTNLLLNKAVPFRSKTLAYKVLNSGGFGYNSNPINDFYWSETNAGPCFMCRKADFLNIHFEDELWLDESPYALPDDQVMFYKMHLSGLKAATLFNSGIVHLDAGTAVATSPDKVEKMLYSEVKNQIIFWHRFIKPHVHGIKRFYATARMFQYKNMRRLLALKNKLRGDSLQWDTVNKAITNAYNFVSRQ